MNSYLTYKGHNITIIFPSGYYEVYLEGRFWKFDCMADAKAAIRKNG